MDQFYFEDGYIESKYYTYVAEAQADLTNYIDSGYISLDYYQGFGIESSLSAELTEKVGEIVEAFGTWTVSVTQTATISHIEGADLFAFSDAALAVAVDRIRDTNIAATVAFDIATDGRAYRDISAAVDAALALSADNERSRAFDSQTQAAFSFASSADRVRSTESTLTVTTSLTVTISHIEGADLVANGFASMTVSSTVDYSAAANLNTAFTQTSTVGQIQTASAALRSRASILVSRYAGPNPPVTVSGSFNSTSLINSSSRSTNLAILPLSDNWFYKTSITVEPTNGNWQSHDIDTTRLFYADLGTRNGSPCYIRAGLRYRGAEGVRIDLLVVLGTDSATGSRLITSAGLTTIPVTTNIAFSFTGGQRVAIYINGQRVVLDTDLQTSGWTIPSNITWEFAPSFPKTSNSVIHYAYTDYAWLTLGNYTNNGNDTTNSTTPTYTEDTIFLYNFNGNGQETTALTFTGAATLSSVASVSASIGGLTNASASLQSTASISCTINHIESVELTAFSNSSLSVTGLRIKSSSASAEASATQTAEINVITDSQFNLSSTAETSIQGNVITDTVIDTEAISTQLTAVVRLAGLLIDDLTESFLTADVNVITENQVVANSEFLHSVTATKITDVDATAPASFTQTASGDRIRFGLLDATSSVSIETAAVRTRDLSSALDTLVTLEAQGQTTASAAADLTTTASIAADTTGFVGIIAYLNSSFAESVNAFRIQQGTAAISSAASFAINTDVSVIRNTSLDITTTAAQTVDANASKEFAVTMQAFVAETAITAKIGDFLITLESSTNLTANAIKTTTTSVDLTVDSGWSATVIKNVDLELGLSSNFAQTTNARTNLDFALDTNGVFAATISPVKTVEAEINLSALGNFDLTARAVRNNEIDIFVSSSMSTAVNRTRNNQADLNSQFDSQFQGTKLVKAQASLSTRFNVLSNVREVEIEEIVYVIPAEIWTYEIVSESRQYAIGQETREYIIS